MHSFQVKNTCQYQLSDCLLVICVLTLHEGGYHIVKLIGIDFPSLHSS